MNKLQVISLALASALLSSLAIAQTAAPGAHAKPDANGDGVVSKDEAAGFPKLAARFDQLDKDRDGKLSGDEWPMRHAGMRDHGDGMRGHGDGLRALDSDHDGRISRAEMQAAGAAQAERFDQLDVNKDGYIDAADRQARMAQRRGECFAKADADKNGQLSRVEFEQMGQACGHPRDGQGGRMPRGQAGNGNPGPLPPKR